MCKYRVQGAGTSIWSHAERKPVKDGHRSSRLHSLQRSGRIVLACSCYDENCPLSPPSRQKLPIGGSLLYLFQIVNEGNEKGRMYAGKQTASF